MHLRRGLSRAEKSSCNTLLESPLSTVSLFISSRALFRVDLLSSFRQFKCLASPLNISEEACSSPAAIAAILTVVVMATCSCTTNKRLLYDSFRFKSSNFYLHSKPFLLLLLSSPLNLNLNVGYIYVLKCFQERQ